MKSGRLVSVVGTLVLLTGCTSPSENVVGSDSPVTPTLIPTEVAPDSRPTFTDDPQDPEHPLPATIAEIYDLDPQTAHYQGEGCGNAVYLSYDESRGSVTMITIDLEDPGSSGAGSGVGNVPSAMGDENGILQYVPQGTAYLPDGWTAVSPHIACHEA